jgi:filamentous hemagglutinin family protein
MKPVSQSLFYLGIPITILVAFTPVARIKAQQILEDNTVGTQVIRDVLIRGIQSDRIDGGTISGGNLFHSFQEFNVGEGRGAYFSNPEGINNILTRVRGENPSNIFGTLGVLGNANLFLINPRGIQFGPNARLDVGGSFFASTADSLVFDNSFEFSASNAIAPPLLTVNTPLGLRFRDNPGNISNQSFAGLEIASGNTLGLVGGNVNLNGGRMTAPGGSVEIGGLTAPGTVGISNSGSLSFPEGVARGDVALSHGARVNVISGGGGSVVINARNLDMSEQSVIVAGIGLGLGTPDSRAGNININATDVVTIDGISSTTSPTVIANAVFGTGSAGEISVNAGSVNVFGNAQISSVTFGQGDAGSVTINAQNNVLFDSSNSGISSNGILSVAGPTVVGNGADININVTNGSLGNGADININVTNGSFFLLGAVLSTSALGKGNSGDVTINASDSIFISNASLITTAFSDDGFAGNIRLNGNEMINIEESTVNSTSNGNRNDSDDSQFNTLSFKASEGSIFINQSEINTTNTGTGLAGDIIFNARDQVAINESEIFSNGQLGRILIGQSEVSGETYFPENIFINQSEINTTNTGTELAGDIIFNARDQVAINESEIFSDGRFGRILIGQSAASGETNSPEIVRVDNSTLNTRNEGAPEKAGNINISGRSIFLANNASLDSRNTGGGLAGDIRLNGNEMINIEESTVNSTSNGNRNDSDDSQFNTLSFKASEGSIFINQSEINTTNTGTGLAGDIIFNARDQVAINESEIFSNGQLGRILIGQSEVSGETYFPENIFINQSEINTTNTGTELAGDIIFNARDQVAINESEIFSDGQLGRILIGQSAASGETNSPEIVSLNSSTLSTTNNSVKKDADQRINAGDISINAVDNISLAKSQIYAFTQRQGDAGNVTLQTEQGNIFLTDEAQIRAAVEPGGEGIAGNINIKGRSLTLTGGGTITATNAGAGEGGNIILEADNLTLDRGEITAESRSASGGNINLNIRDLLLLRRKSQISATAGREQGSGDGGNINIKTGFLVGFPKENSDITANAFTGTGGRVNIQAESIFGMKPLSRADLQRLLNTTDPNLLDPSSLPSSDITAISQENPSLSGQVNITTPDVDPSKGLVELPENVTDPNEQIAQNPCKQGVGSEFVEVGRGGLPINPNQPLSSSTVRVDLVNPLPGLSNNSKKSNSSQFNNYTEKLIIPAQGWVFNSKGEVVLTAYDPKNINVQRIRQTSAICPER